jgi:hypothetical protein
MEAKLWQNVQNVEKK